METQNSSGQVNIILSSLIFVKLYTNVFFKIMYFYSLDQL